MGGILKKFTVLRALLLCFAVVFSLVSIAACVSLFRTTDKSLPSPSADEEESTEEWVKLVSGTISGFSDHDDLNKVARISTEGALANLNRAITDDIADYSGWTFIIDRDLDMARYHDNYGQNCKPLWTPINSTAGRNTGIIIEGNGNKISNLLITMNDDATQAKGVKAKNGVGFFGNLTGCTVRNIVFENTIINYNYQGSSKLATDETRPTTPVKVAVGVVAGIAENSYISNVTLVNPEVNVTTNNANGHNIYVGTAVGKMVYDDKNATPLLHSLTNPDEEPEHRWGVDTVAVKGGKVGLTVLPGENTADGAYGVATNGYIGGVVGYNNSGKIINCKVKGLNIAPQMAGVAGTYYAGGLVGYTMLRVPTLNDVVLSGVINNVIMDTTIASSQATYTGMLAGYVYDNWVYNNISLGNDQSLYGEIRNRYYFPFYDTCLGYHDYETFLGNDYFDISDYSACKPISFGNYVYCSKHAATDLYSQLFPFTDGKGQDDGDYIAYIEKYNYQMTKSEFSDFQNGTTFGKLDDFENADGNFYEIGTQKVKNEYKAEINTANIRSAVNELRIWRVVNGEPDFGDNLGYDYDVVFCANGDKMKNPATDSEAGRCNAGWVEEGYYIEVINPEMLKKCKYKEPILEPEVADRPSAEGWNFIGWFADPECTREFDFSNALMGVNGIGVDGDGNMVGINIYAKWEVGYYKVSYYLDNETPYCVEEDVPYEEIVPFGKFVVGPSEIRPNLPQNDRFYGKSATGNWYTMTEGFDENMEPILIRGESWIFGNNDNYTPMPGHEIKLYAELYDNFEVLREELESAAVTNAFGNREYYTAQSFARFDTAYQNAFAVIEAYNADKLEDESLREKTVDQIIDELRASLAALMVDIEWLKNSDPFNENLDQNRYPFLYDYNSYKEYTEIKRTAQNYLNVEINNEGMLSDLERYKYIRDSLISKYNNLSVNRNPNIGMNADLIAEVKHGYSQIITEIDTFNPADYTDDSWRNSNFELCCSQFKEAFKNDYSNPYIADMKAAIDNYNHAKAQLVRGQGAPANPNGQGGNSNGGVPLVVIGVLVALIAVLGVGGYIGVDIYLNKKVRPKKEQAEKAEQAAAEDTYI